MQTKHVRHRARCAAYLLGAFASLCQSALAQSKPAVDAEKAGARVAALLWYFPRSFQYDAHMVSQVAFSPDGKQLVAISTDILNDAIRVFDLEADKERIRFGGPQRGYTCMVFTADGKTLFTAGYDRELLPRPVEQAPLKSCVILQWSPMNGRETLRFQPTMGEILSIHLTESEKTLISIHVDGKLRFWDVATGKEKRSWTAPAGRNDPLVLGPDGHTVALVSEDRSVELWDAERGVRVRQLAKPPPEKWEKMDRLAYSPDGRLLACADHMGKSIQILDTTTGAVKRQFPQPPGPLRGRWAPMAFSPDSTMLALHDGQSGVVWDSATGKELLRDDRPWRYTVAFSRDSKRLTTGPSWTGPKRTASLHLWELAR